MESIRDSAGGRPSAPRPGLEAVGVRGMTRAAFLLRATLAAGAAAGAGAVGPFVARALAQDPDGGDLGILNYALTLELLEAEYYARGLAEVRGLSAEVRSLAERLRDDEQAHVDSLRQRIQDLGGTPAPEPGFDFGDAFGGQASFLQLANRLEDTGVSAYNGAAPAVESRDVLALIGTIVQVEARHAALVRLRRDRPPAPLAFDRSSERDEVLEAIQDHLA